jgi:hypothetical protein
MELWETILKDCPALTEKSFIDGTVKLQDDSDGKGAYIAEWNHDKPLPAGLKIGK